MSRTKDRTYLRHRRILFETTDVCALCGQPINPDLEYPDPMSKSADHIVPISKGGHNRGPLQAAHLQCNKRRGNRQPTPLRHARHWR